MILDNILDNIFYIAVIIVFLVVLYRRFCWKPKIKVAKAPTTKQIRRQRKRARRLRKFSRHFRIPYVGHTEIIEYDKTNPYIESIWEEMRRK